MAAVDRSASVEVILSLKGSRLEQAREWTGDRPLDLFKMDGQNAVKLSIAPGGVQIVELVESRRQ
jgi:hypothetical protein